VLAKTVASDLIKHEAMIRPIDTHILRRGRAVQINYFSECELGCHALRIVDDFAIN
jgi:hypothetical protein